MNLLLKMILSSQNAKAAIKLAKKKKLMIVNKKHGMAIDDAIIDAGGVSVNLGGYGATFSVNIGEKFFNSWGFTNYTKRNPNIYSDTGSMTEWESFSVDYAEERGKGLSNLNIYLFEEKKGRNKASWEKPLDEIVSQITDLGGTVCNDLDKADLIVTQDMNSEPQVKDDVLTIYQTDFLRVLPKVASERATPVKKFTGDSGSLWKLISVRDYTSIQQGIELAGSLPEQIDDLLEGCSTDKTGELSRSKRFSGSGPALAFLDVALLGLLSIAPAGSNSEKLRKSLKKLSITVGAVPKMTGFDNLEELNLEFVSGAELDKKNLSNLATMSKLKVLKISAEGYGSEVLDSLKGLDAPNLENIDASSVGLRDISALATHQNLKVVDLSRNYELKSIDGLSGSAKNIEELSLDGCSKLQNIESLKGATNLKKINISSCESLKSIKPLSECAKLEEFDMDYAELRSLEGLENFKLKKVLVTYNLKVNKELRLQDLLSLNPGINDPKFMITQLSIKSDDE